MQLISIRESYKEKYYESRFDKLKETHINEIQNSQGNLDSSKDDDEMSNQNSNLADNSNLRDDIAINFKKLKKKSILVVGDSLLNGIEESKLSKTRHIRVQPISGGKIYDIERNLTELLNKDLKLIIFHIGTNHSTTESPEVILQKILSLKERIQFVLPNCKIVISNIIVRTDNNDANRTNEKVNTMLKRLEIDILDNSNIKEKHGLAWTTFKFKW